MATVVDKAHFSPLDPHIPSPNSTVLKIVERVDEPNAINGCSQIFVDTDGVLKVIDSDGNVQTVTVS